MSPRPLSSFQLFWKGFSSLDKMNIGLCLGILTLSFLVPIVTIQNIQTHFQNEISSAAVTCDASIPYSTYRSYSDPTAIPTLIATSDLVQEHYHFLYLDLLIPTNLEDVNMSIRLITLYEHSSHSSTSPPTQTGNNSMFLQGIFANLSSSTQIMGINQDAIASSDLASISLRNELLRYIDSNTISHYNLSYDFAFNANLITDMYSIFGNEYCGLHFDEEPYIFVPDTLLFINTSIFFELGSTIRQSIHGQGIIQYDKSAIIRHGALFFRTFQEKLESTIYFEGLFPTSPSLPYWDLTQDVLNYNFGKMMLLTLYSAIFLFMFCLIFYRTILQIFQHKQRFLLILQQYGLEIGLNTSSYFRSIRSHSFFYLLAIEITSFSLLGGGFYFRSGFPGSWTQIFQLVGIAGIYMSISNLLLYITSYLAFKHFLLNNHHIEQKFHKSLPVTLHRSIFRTHRTFSFYLLLVSYIFASILCLVISAYISRQYIALTRPDQIEILLTKINRLNIQCLVMLFTLWVFLFLKYLYPHIQKALLSRWKHSSRMQTYAPVAVCIDPVENPLAHSIHPHYGFLWIFLIGLGSIFNAISIVPNFQSLPSDARFNSPNLGILLLILVCSGILLYCNLFSQQRWEQTHRIHPLTKRLHRYGYEPPKLSHYLKRKYRVMGFISAVFHSLYLSVVFGILYWINCQSVNLISTWFE